MGIIVGKGALPPVEEVLPSGKTAVREREEENANPAGGTAGRERLEENDGREEKEEPGAAVDGGVNGAAGSEVKDAAVAAAGAAEREKAKPVRGRKAQPKKKGR